MKVNRVQNNITLDLTDFHCIDKPNQTKNKEQRTKNKKHIKQNIKAKETKQNKSKKKKKQRKRKQNKTLSHSLNLLLSPTEEKISIQVRLEVE